VRRLEFENDTFAFGDKLINKWYSGEAKDKSGLLLVVSAGKDGALTGGRAFMAAVGDDLIDSVVGDNIPILTGEEKYNETVTSSVARVVAKLSGKEDPGPPFRCAPHLGRGPGGTSLRCRWSAGPLWHAFCQAAPGSRPSTLNTHTHLPNPTPTLMINRVQGGAGAPAHVQDQGGDGGQEARHRHHRAHAALHLGCARCPARRRWLPPWPCAGSRPWCVPPPRSPPLQWWCPCCSTTDTPTR
jgi:hypothetical protein